MCGSIPYLLPYVCVYAYPIDLSSAGAASRFELNTKTAWWRHTWGDGNFFRFDAAPLIALPFLVGLLAPDLPGRPCQMLGGEPYRFQGCDVHSRGVRPGAGACYGDVGIDTGSSCLA